MMRELLFRQAIFHPVTGEFLKWHYWGLIDKVFVGIDTGWYSPTQAIENSYQYTGLKDKNGKEIYEGDIVKHWMREWENEEIIYDDEYSMFRFDSSIWPHQSLGEWLGEIWTRRSLEVIGNIYENPELLEL